MIGLRVFICCGTVRKLVHALHIARALLLEKLTAFQHDLRGAHRVVDRTVVFERNMKMLRDRIQFMIFQRRQRQTA